MTEADPLILFDSEDGIDETAWVAISSAATPAAAEVILSRLAKPDPGLAYLCEGKSWHHRKEDNTEFEFWESCSADHPDAVCFWQVLLLDQEDKFPPSELMVCADGLC